MKLLALSNKENHSYKLCMFNLTRFFHAEKNLLPFTNLAALVGSIKCPEGQLDGTENKQIF